MVLLGNDIKPVHGGFPYLKDFPGSVQINLPGLGWDHPVVFASEQRMAQLGFFVFKALADGGG